MSTDTPQLFLLQSRTRSTFLHDQLFSAPSEPWVPDVAPQRTCRQPCPGTALVESPRSSGQSAPLVLNLWNPPRFSAQLELLDLLHDRDVHHSIDERDHEQEQPLTPLTQVPGTFQQDKPARSHKCDKESSSFAVDFNTKPLLHSQCVIIQMSARCCHLVSRHLPRPARFLTQPPLFWRSTETETVLFHMHLVVKTLLSPTTLFMLISSLHCHGASAPNTTLDDLSTLLRIAHPQERLNTSEGPQLR